jgi:endonuclease-3 related protein
MVTSPTNLYELLLDAFGNQHWWPVDTKYHQRHHSDPRFEVIIGAILTQNTAWTNVEKALENLKKHNTLTILALTNIEEKNLKTMIQPSGFFNQKAQRLKFFAAYLEKEYNRDLQKFFSRDTSQIRHELLSVPGIGPETADSILLYAGNHPVFVVDAYTKRICHRLPYPVSSTSYDDIQQFFENELSTTILEKERTSVYKEFHALLVELAKQYCWKKKPYCRRCPLNLLCEKLL